MIQEGKWVRVSTLSCSATTTGDKTDLYDNVEKPKHYNIHPSGVECIQITEHMNFCLGNAMKYIWRAEEKNGVEDLKKAVWYLNREISRREPK